MSDNIITEALKYSAGKYVKTDKKSSKNGEMLDNNVLFVYDTKTHEITWGWLLKDIKHNYKSRMLLNYFTSKEIENTEDMYLKYTFLRAKKIPNIFMNIVIAIGVYLTKADYYALEEKGNPNHLICRTYYKYNN